MTTRKRKRRQQAKKEKPETKVETGGSIMSFKDKIKAHQGTILHWVITVGVVAIIGAVMVMFLAITPSNYNADMARFEQGLTTMGSDVADNTQDIGQLQSSQLTDDDLEPIVNATATNQGNITALDSRLTGAEGNITAICDDLANLDGSPPEAWLTGNLTAGNITIHAKASMNGTYTANVHLVFASVAANWTTTVNWAAANVREYIAVENHTGNVTGTWWNIGSFGLVADTEKTISVRFGGLADTVAFAYAEIWSVLK